MYSCFVVRLGEGLVSFGDLRFIEEFLIISYIVIEQVLTGIEALFLLFFDECVVLDCGEFALGRGVAFLFKLLVVEGVLVLL